MIVIYKITSPSGKIYIGQTTNYSKRHNAYKNHKCKGQPKLFASIEKYGFINHTIEIIKECQVEDLNYYERYYQEYYESVLDGLNLRYTATTDKSGFMSEETKKKMSDSGKGKIITEEWKKNLALVWLGRKHTEETKKKMSESAKGKEKTAEHIAKLPQNQKGFKKKPHSEETKTKIAEGLKRHFSQKFINAKNLSIFVICTSVKSIFLIKVESIIEITTTSLF